MKKFIKENSMFCVLVAVAFIMTLLMGDMTMEGDAFTIAATGAAFAPLKWAQGQNNMGGFKPRVLFIPFDAVTGVPQLPTKSAATSNADYVTATGTFTYTAGTTKPVYLYSTDGEVGYKAAPQGEVDGKSFVQTMNFFFPGNTPEMHAFNALVKNTPGIYVIEDADGQQQVIGLEGFPANISADYNGGQKRADRRGTAYTVTCDSNYSAVFLETPLDFEAAAAPEA